uniref:Uncharacterized protein n=1 Tax=Romanomermis culicivorax TaxID=13658 RepID=A0A915L5H5_ROMCU
MSARPKQTATADFKVTTAQINDFLKLMLEDISTLAPIPMDESTPVQPTTMDTETNITTTDQTLTHIPEETTADKSTTIDVTPEEPATVAALPAPTLDPCIYHTTFSVLPVPPMMATIAAARLPMESLGC